MLAYARTIDSHFVHLSGFDCNAATGCTFVVISIGVGAPAVILRNTLESGAIEDKTVRTCTAFDARLVADGADVRVGADRRTTAHAVAVVLVGLTRKWTRNVVSPAAHSCTGQGLL
jgi:hypothetical protein